MRLMACASILVFCLSSFVIRVQAAEGVAEYQVVKAPTGEALLPLESSLRGVSFPNYVIARTESSGAARCYFLSDGGASAVRRGEADFMPAQDSLVFVGGRPVCRHTDHPPRNYPTEGGTAYPFCVLEGAAAKAIQGIPSVVNEEPVVSVQSSGGPYFMLSHFDDEGKAARRLYKLDELTATEIELPAGIATPYLMTSQDTLAIMDTNTLWVYRDGKPEIVRTGRTYP